MEKIIVLPLAPLRDGPVFPNTDVPLVFGRSKSVAALKSASESNRLIFITGQKDSNVVDTTQENLQTIGTICQIKHIFQSESEVNVLVSGVSRAKIVRLQSMNDFWVAEVEEIPDQPIEDAPAVAALVTHITTEFQNAIKLGRGFDFFVLMRVTSGLGATELANQMAQVLDFTPAEKQAVLEETNVQVRLKKVADQLAKEINVIELERKIINSSQAKFDKNIKENILKERKRAIEEELGEIDDETNEVKELETKAKKLGMPDEILKKTLKEIKRLSRMSNMNPEAGYIRTYVEWLLDMPWKKDSIETTDIKKAEKILNEDHYGLEKAKERILEYLAVLKLKSYKKVEKQSAETIPEERSRKASTPTILCFVGPPGVGKTSIGKSIAKALGRKFVRVSLGGVRDEAEIRGHRRTYVGAMPGRILQGIKQAGSRNPVFMLDEIDKLSSDFHGDPSAALLEALDPEQNYAFVDHYLEVPLTSEKVTLPDEVLKTIITRYTREAGVRGLEREIATVFRKVAKKFAVLNSKIKTVEVKQGDLHKYLGPYKFTSTIAERKDEIGLSTGLYWSAVGGGIMLIEVAIMPGKGGLILTGRLGDVMQESAKAAMSYVRSRWKELGLDEKVFQKIDVHIHVPEGATPKDGPSAGVALTIALVSALTKVPVKKFVGMTGEVN
ncbi:LON peptidase substrate-binding domain-containing protein [Candidatus Microgenomates bacterium]|nr:LON peptidase substrate-binding domain-containing protein [Candidatus Microgenomates bacterium]